MFSVWSSEYSSVVVSSAVDITAKHTDITDADGDHQDGATYDGKVSISATYVGAPTITNGSFIKTEDTRKENNQTFDMVSTTHVLARS